MQCTTQSYVSFGHFFRLSPFISTNPFQDLGNLRFEVVSKLILSKNKKSYSARREISFFRRPFFTRQASRSARHSRRFTQLCQPRFSLRERHSSRLSSPVNCFFELSFSFSFHSPDPLFDSFKSSQATVEQFEALQIRSLPLLPPASGKAIAHFEPFARLVKERAEKQSSVLQSLSDSAFTPRSEAPRKRRLLPGRRSVSDSHQVIFEGQAYC